MNAKLKSQIKTYTGVAGALLAANKASGQIVYVDVNPDTLVDASPMGSGIHDYLLDVDTDGVMDFQFQVKWDSSNGSSQSVNISPFNGNKVMNGRYWVSSTHSGTFGDFPARLSSGDTIKFVYSYYHFWNANPQEALIFSNGSCQGGGWDDFNNDHFLPFTLYKNSYYEYGWIRLRTLSRHSFIIRDYAYNTIPNAPILAGDTTNASLSIKQISNTVFISQYHNNILINSATQLQNAAIKIYDLLGKEIHSQIFTGTQTEISIDKKGIYVVEVRGAENIFRKKIFVY